MEDDEIGVGQSWEGVLGLIHNMCIRLNWDSFFLCVFFVIFSTEIFVNWKCFNFISILESSRKI